VTPAELATIERRLSAERLSVYRTAVGGDLEKAVRLYEWNRDLASALGATLGDVEVVVRNAMHEQLTAWSTSRHGQPWWYLDPGAVLTDRATKDITKARDRATYDGKPETPGRVVAELGFGFWRYMLASRYDRVLWLPCLRQAFPGLRGRGVRRDVEHLMHLLYDARNRIAHQEPMHNRPVAQVRSAAMEVVEWVCPVAKRWIEGRCAVRAVLSRRP
jgi:hypothetical protein